MQKSRGEYRNSYKNDSFDRNKNRSRERSFSRNYGNNRISLSRSRPGSRASRNRNRTHCCKCREYDYFARNCPSSREEKEIEQLQQILNLGNEQLITPSMINMQAELNRVSSEVNLRANHLNL